MRYNILNIIKHCSERMTAVPSAEVNISSGRRSDIKERIRKCFICKYVWMLKGPYRCFVLHCWLFSKTLQPLWTWNFLWTRAPTQRTSCSVLVIWTEASSLCAGATGRRVYLKKFCCCGEIMPQSHWWALLLEIQTQTTNNKQECTLWGGYCQFGRFLHIQGCARLKSCFNLHHHNVLLQQK